RELGVRYVLEGSQQQSAKRVRVSAQLIDAASGAHLWADQFDADRADLLEMQDEIVTRLSRALQVQLVEVDAARVARTHPDDLDAEGLAMRCEAILVKTQRRHRWGREWGKILGIGGCRETNATSKHWSTSHSSSSTRS